MANEAVGIKTGISIKKQTIDEKGEVKKTVFFFPDLGQSVEAETLTRQGKLPREMLKIANQGNKC